MILGLKYLAPYQTLSYSDKPRAYYEAVMSHTDSMDINLTKESPIDATSTIFYSKCIIKKIIKSGTWGFDLTNSKTMNINYISHRFNYWDYHKGLYDVVPYQNKKNKHT